MIDDLDLLADLDMPDEWKIVGNDQLAGVPTKNQGFIMTGLGGVDRKLRYFVVIPSFVDVDLEANLENSFKDNFKNLFHENKSSVENLVIKKSHIEMMLLINMDYSVEEIVMAFIKEVNSENKLLTTNYFVTNTNKSSDEEIKNYVADVKKDFTNKSLKTIAKILNVDKINKIPAVNKISLQNYFKYLSDNLVFSIKAISDSGKEITILSLLPVGNYAGYDQLICLCVKEKNENVVKIPLSELSVSGKGENYNLIKNFNNWFWNFK